MKEFFKTVFNDIKNLFWPHDPAYDFAVNKEAAQVGGKLFVEKGRHRIEIFEGEKDFYLANGWVEVDK